MLNRLFTYTLSLLFTIAILSIGSKGVFSGFNTDNYLPETYINIGIPEGIEVMDNGDIWYVDSQNYRVVKVNQSGEVLRVVGREGFGDGEFECPLTDITSDSDGFIYVLSHCKVYVLDDNGGMVDRWGEQGGDFLWQFSIPKGIAYDSYTDSILVTDTNHHRITGFSKSGEFRSSMGNEGSLNGQFYEPQGITTDSAGNIYIVDTGNHRVQAFTSEFVHIFTFGSEPDFEFPKDIVLMENGNLAVTSQNNQKVYIYSTAGNFVDSWGDAGSDVDQFQFPQYLATDSSNNLFITDWDTRSIQSFTHEGTFNWIIRNASTEDGKFYFPNDVAYDSEGYLYVLDFGHDQPRIQKFTNSGVFVEIFAGPEDIGIAAYHMHIDDNDMLYVTHESGVKVFNPDKSLALSFGTPGDGNGEFDNARGIATDSEGLIYVADRNNNRVQKFDDEGTYVGQWGTFGNGEGEFDGPEDLFIDTDWDDIFVVDNHRIHDGLEVPNTRIQMFGTDGYFYDTIGQFGEGDEYFSNLIGGIAMDGDSNLWVTDKDYNRVLIFDRMSLEFTESFGISGGGLSEFDGPSGIALNPDTGNMTIVDTNNHRVQGIGEGVKIYNLIPSSDVIRNDLGESLVTKYYSPSEEGIDSLDSEMYFGRYIVSDFNVDLTEDRDWTEVNAISLPTQGVAVIQNLNPESAPGVSESHSLYVPKQDGSVGVYVCPYAQSIAEVSYDCEDGYPIFQGEDGLAVETIEEVEYWKISELTGTGAMGMFSAHEFEVVPSSTSLEVGESFSLTITALDEDGNLVPTYNKLVVVTSTGFDGSTTYQFDPSDLGEYTFNDFFSFASAGTYTIRVEDFDDENVFGETVEITVVAGDDSEDEDDDPDNGGEDNDTVPEIEKVVNIGSGSPTYSQIITSIIEGDDTEDADTDEEDEDEHPNVQTGGFEGSDYGGESNEEIESGESNSTVIDSLWKILGWSALVLIVIYMLFLLLKRRKEEEYQ